MSLPNEVIVSTSKLTALGDAIRSRFGVSGELALDEMAEIVSPLPSGYQKVDYIETSGGQWINTGVHHSEWNEFYGEVMLSNIGTYTHILFGSGNGGGGGMAEGNKLVILSATETQNKLRVGFGGNWILTSQSPLSANQKYKILLPLFENNKQIVKIDDGNEITGYISDTKTYTKASTNPDINSYPVFLFTTGRGGEVTSGAEYFFVGKFYGGAFLKDLVKIRDFVPCYRKSDNKIGLYDIINGQFYTNSGSGSFTCYPSPSN